MTQKLFQPNEGTLRILGRFEQMKQGEIVEWEELSQLLQLDARKEGRRMVASARRIMELRHHKVFRTVPGLGVKFLNDSEIPALMHEYVVGGRLLARAGRRKSVGIQNYAALSRTDQVELHARSVQLGMIEAAASQKQIEACNKKVDNGKPLSPLSLDDFD